MAWFSHTIAGREKELLQNLDMFVHNIRPNPLAAKFNKNLLTSRGGDMRILLKELANFQDHVLGPIEQSINALRRDHYTLLFRVRFSILEYRARAVLALDSLKVAQALLRMEDPSNEVQRQAEVLQSVAIQECVNCVEYCRASLDRSASSPAAQVELLLQQVQFGTMAGISDSSELMEKADMLSRQYPNTAGAFAENVNSFHQHSGSPLVTPPVTNMKSRNVEKDWGHHAVGHLAICPAKHPYSTETFSGCPECGKKVELENEVYGRTQAFLQENEFLRAMNMKKS